MTNAKEEFLKKIDCKAKVKCAGIFLDIEIGIIKKILKVNYTNEDYNSFLESLDFNYDVGCDDLYGMIWLEDGNWFERENWEGHQWWQYRYSPEIYKECL